MDTYDIEMALEDDYDISDSEFYDSDNDPEFVLNNNHNESDSGDSDDNLLGSVDNLENNCDCETISFSNISLNFAWEDYNVENHKIFQFTGNEGIQTHTVNIHSTAIDIFKLFFNDGLVNLIVRETNVYANQVLQSTRISRNSRLNNWTDTNSQEIQVFFGIFIWMGLNVRPALSDYWSNDPLYKNDFTSHLMTRNRFELLMRMFHFNDNQIPNPNDKLVKIRPFLTLLKNNIQSVYSVGEKMVIDESMIAWRGRLGFRQCIPGKKHKFGVKVLKLCTENGYTYDFEIYSGREVNTVTATSNVGEKIVMKLTNNLLNAGRTLYTDNFYTSCVLARVLLQNKTHLIGTLRKNWKYLPKDVEQIPTRNKRASPNNITLTPKVKPKVIIDYNTGKCGIDKSDQMTSYACVNRRGVKWYRKVALELITGMAMVNACIIFKELIKSKITVTSFRREVCKSLLGIETQTRLPPTKSVIHILQPRTGGGTSDRKQCVLCYENLTKLKKLSRDEARKRVKKFKTFCNGCPKKPTMCFECHIAKHK
ncbi:hypothetical protein QTP88_000775 [Uroleucon formosanum]